MLEVKHLKKLVIDSYWREEEGTSPIICNLVKVVTAKVLKLVDGFYLSPHVNDTLFRDSKLTYLSYGMDRLMRTVKMLYDFDYEDEEDSELNQFKL